MHGLFFALLAVSTAPAEAPGRETARPSSKCAEGTPRPSSSSSVRPMQTGRCRYDIHGAYARMLDLLRVREGRVDLKYMERLFGLPRLHTAYDDPSVAHYTVFIAGGAGDSGWKGLLTFSEAFVPSVETRPLHSQGSMRPRPIRKGERGTIYLSINLLPLAPPQPWKGCVTVAEFEKRALARGWSHPAEPTLPSPHGGPPPLFLERGRLSLSLSSGNAIGCLTEVTLNQEADPFTLPVTGAEDEAIRLKSARKRRPMSRPSD